MFFVVERMNLSAQEVDISLTQYNDFAFRFTFRGTIGYFNQKFLSLVTDDLVTIVSSPAGSWNDKFRQRLIAALPLFVASPAAREHM